MSHILAAEIVRLVRERTGLSQQELATRAGTSQPAVARIEGGGVSPTLATLDRLVAAAGFTLRIELAPTPEPDRVVAAYKRDVDRTLLRENLRKSVQERLDALAELQELAAAARAARPARRRRVR